MLRRTRQQVRRGSCVHQARRNTQGFGGKGLYLLAILALAACSPRPQVGVPPIADIEAATEAKPKPTAAILTDPAADALYNSAVEGWGDRVRAAGVRLCRFYRDVGVTVECGGS